MLEYRCTLLPQYNTIWYNMIANTTRKKCGPQIFVYIFRWGLADKEKIHNFGRNKARLLHILSFSPLIYCKEVPIFANPDCWKHGLSTSGNVTLKNSKSCSHSSRDMYFGWYITRLLQILSFSPLIYCKETPVFVNSIIENINFQLAVTWWYNMVLLTTQWHYLDPTNRVLLGEQTCQSAKLMT